ncbi:uroporphyrinogen-III synthase [Pseudarthrobacter sp. fls2-241-R2A-127]|uniref:uroporphyrinogen-III synthase n=1 Tax=Pseudarthrobacter sp. fls2-241-R2A-127 TaxID=3040303 RepID=UPI0025578AAA|nr:uroporphyrinogen-III synthase [Pseudarthrobacter sp. fls2-241-R2A-127]
MTQPSPSSGPDKPPSGHQSGQPLAGTRVLVTRSPERATALVDALERAGASTVLLPLIDFERAPDQHALDVNCDALAAGAFDWLVVSSATTVHVLLEKAADRGLGLDALIPAGTRIAAIGPATRRLLESGGLTVALVPAAEQSAAGLLDAWPGGGRILLPQADIAAPTLADGLRAAGGDVTTVTAYCTVDYPAAAERRLAVQPQDGGTARQPPSYSLLTPEAAAADMAAGRIDAAIAASPSAVRRLSALTPGPACRLVVIGRSTADQAAALGLDVAAVADQPTPEGLVAAVAKALNPP